MIEGQPQLDTRVAIIIQYPVIGSDPIFHNISHTEGILFFNEGGSKTFTRKEYAQDFDQEMEIDKVISVMDVIFMFGKEGARLQYIEKPKPKSRLIARNQRHLALLKGQRRWELITGYVFGDIYKAALDFTDTNQSEDQN